MDLDDARTDDIPQAKLARSGRLIVLAGFVPFAVLALWLYGIALDHPWRHGTIVLLSAYAAAILSFLGGIRWGLAMVSKQGEAERDIILSAVPPLIGWIAVIVPAPVSFVFLAVAFAAQGAWDSLTLAPKTVPDWFRRARFQMTLLVVAALVVAFVATS